MAALRVHECCDIKSEIGKMHATYQMKNLLNKQMFTFAIPDLLK